jgi:RNA polymerase sigma-70 factor (ECF subfamily)
MTAVRTEPLGNLSKVLSEHWHLFLDVYEPLRPALYRYARYLTRSPWDAEDLTQDTMCRAFVTLAQMMGSAPSNPRAWLFRVASNLWIDQRRRQQPDPIPSQPHEHDVREPREAIGTLVTSLAPQERAAVVLKDVFDFSLEEVAENLGTTVGAVKAALHRGRGKLREVNPAPEPPGQLVPAELEVFCSAFNARDLDKLTSLLLDTASIEVVGVHAEYGPEAAKHGVFLGMLYGAERMAQADSRGGIDARFIQGVLPVPPRAELRQHRGEVLMLLWYQHHDGEAVRAINRAQLGGGQISSFKNYFFTPDLLAEICGELNVPFRSNGYSYWLSGC